MVFLPLDRHYRRQVLPNSGFTLLWLYICADDKRSNRYDTLSKILDELLETDVQFGVLYSNPREQIRLLPVVPHDRAQGIGDGPKVLPLYRQRMLERQRICNGVLKHGLGT